MKSAAGMLLLYISVVAIGPIEKLEKRHRYHSIPNCPFIDSSYATLNELGESDQVVAVVVEQVVPIGNVHEGTHVKRTAV